MLDHRDFIPFLERRADLCILLLRLLCQRLRQTDRQVEDAMFGRLDDRIAKALVRLAHGAPPRRRGGSAPAHLAAGARRHGRRQPRERQQAAPRLAEAGVLRLGKRLIEIPDIAAIEALA